MTRIFLDGTSNAMRRLELIVDTLKRHGLPKMGIKVKDLKIYSLQDIVVRVNVLKFSVMACARTKREAATHAAEMMLLVMGFTKPQCLISVAARKRAFENAADGGSGAGECTEEADMTGIFKNVCNDTARLKKILDTMQAGDPSFSVRYETHELQSRADLKFVKCIVGEYSTIANGCTVQIAQQLAAMLMLLKLGFLRRACFLSDEFQRSLKTMHDEYMSSLNKVKRRLNFSDPKYMVRL